MAGGVYGINRGADVKPNDCEVWLHYTPNRASVGQTQLTQLTSEDVLIQIDNPNKTVTGFEIFGGMYTLKLPVSQINQKGIYTIYIKPIEIRTRIVDCGVLSSNPDIRGILFDLGAVPSGFANRFENNNLIGYRIEYLNPDTSVSDVKIRNLYRIITSNNRAEPVNQNLTNVNQKAIRYNFNDNSTLVFCTVTPSSAPTVKPNAFPFIGQPNQQIILTNTFFNPLMIEIEVTDYDIETLAYGIFGNQTKSLEDGIYTIYNFDNDIYKQYNLFEIKDQFTGKPLYEVREERNNIDFNKTFDNIVP